MQTSTADSRTSGQARQPVHLAPNLNQNLLNYAAAASAAGISLLALAHPADAKVIYTPANIPITYNGGLVQLDLNNDGVADFSFYAASGSGFAARHHKRTGRPPLGGFFAYMEVIPTQPSNEAGAITSFTGAVCAAEIPKDREINNNKDWQPNALDLFAAAGDYTSPGSADCPWRGANNKGGFLPLRFTLNGQIYYGWARISLTGGAVITGYAYENDSTLGIKSGQIGGQDEKSDANPAPATTLEPQPASLGALARGASGLPVWRWSELMN